MIGAMRTGPTQQAIDAAGGVLALARLLNISGAAVAQWDQVPATRCREVSKLTGLPLHVLRPDIYDAPQRRTRANA